MLKAFSTIPVGGAFLVLAAVGLLAVCADPAGTDSPAAELVGVGAPDGHQHSQAGSESSAPDVELLTGRSSSPDDINAQIRLRLDGTGPTHVMNMNRGVDNMVLAKLTFEPGDLVDWHVHPGPVIVIVDYGVLTVKSGRDCVAREYGPDETYIEQGPGDVLRVSNETGNDTVIYALFFQVPEEGPLTIFEDDPGC